MDIQNLRAVAIRARRDPEHKFTPADFSFSFTDKGTYLDWVWHWKRDYAILSDEIRELKRKRKPGVASTDEVPETYKGDPHNFFQSRAYYYGLTAHGMLIMRKVAKQHSWALKQAESEKVAV